MAREIPNKPHPTPNPDGWHAFGSHQGSDEAAYFPLGPEDASATEVPLYDARFDDLSESLYPPIADPDPILIAHSSSDMVRLTSPENDAVPITVKEGKKQPRTSEIFDAVGSRSDDSQQATSIVDAAEAPSPRERWSDMETVFEGGLVETSESLGQRPRTTRAVGWAWDDDRLEPRTPWALLILMTYSSAVTLALTWFVWTGRTARSTESRPADINQTEVESVPKIASASPVGVLPPLPEENVAGVGNKIQIGELEVTPLGIALTPLSLVRSIDPSDGKREESASLVLRLKLTNISSAHEFAPLERRFIREQTAAVDRSTIVASQGRAIDLFPLAVDSEWLIEGQVFTTLKPGETVETLIASEPGVADRLTDDMTWHVRLRISPYRTDVMGVRFDKSEIQE